MNWSDLPLHPTPKALRQFSAAWLLFFLCLGTHQYFVREHQVLALLLGLMAVLIGTLGLIKPAAVRWIFVAWMVLAFPIGWLVSQLMLALLFFVVLTPVAILFRLRGRDLLDRKPAPEKSTFWTKKSMPENVESYFRQY